MSELPEVAPLLAYDADGNLIRIADLVPADMNCDGLANFDDVDCFVGALGCTDGQNPPAGYAGCLPCDRLLGDFDGDGDVAVQAVEAADGASNGRQGRRPLHAGRGRLGISAR